MEKNKSPKTTVNKVESGKNSTDFNDEEARAAEATYAAEHEAEDGVDVDRSDSIVSVFDPSQETLVSAIRNDYQGFMRGDDGEPIIVDLRKISIKTRPIKPANDIPYLQAHPLTIRPSRAKPVKRDFKRILAFGDHQIAYREYDGKMHETHDERAIKVTRLLARDADLLINLGDTVDLPEFSRFDPDSNHFSHRTLQAAFNRVHSMYAELRADNPHKEIHEVDSNHNLRLAKIVLKQLGVMSGFSQAGSEDKYPMLTYPYMANLENVGVTWHSGYGTANYTYNKQDSDPTNRIIFRHGKEITSAGSTAQMLNKKYPYSNLVVGHGHQTQLHARTTPEGKYVTTAQVGTLAKITGEVPSYHSAIDDHGHPVENYENWQQSVLQIDDYGNGSFQYTPIYIRDGVAQYNGKEYNFEEIDYQEARRR